MSKHYLSLLAFVTLLCMMLIGAFSCKKSDSGATPNSDNPEFFIDADYLSDTDTDGKVAPRLMLNFNDEAVMIELKRPSDSDPMESILFLYPDNKATMMCGNDTMMISAEYNMDTHMPSNDVLLVTQRGDDALLLTKCVMDWTSNTITIGDMMVLPVDNSSRKYGNRVLGDDDIRVFFFRRFMKPLSEKLGQIENFCGTLGIPQGIVVSYMRTILMTQTANFLFSDDQAMFLEAMEIPVTAGTAQSVQTGILMFVPKRVADMASRVLSAIGWFTSGGHGSVNAGGSVVSNDPPMESFFNKGRIAVETSYQIGTLDPVFIIGLNVSNITENSVYLKGTIDYGSNHIMPIEMGYVYKISGGPEHMVEDMGFNGKTVTGLQKATKYTVYAYARSFSDNVPSPSVTFWTLGFDAFPTSLEFSAEGDSKPVALLYSESDVTGWDITSKPSWCDITKDSDKMFTVTVDKTTEPRTGSITVTAHSMALGSLTQNITVSQRGANDWDGTSWIFSGQLTYNTQGQTSVDNYECTLVVNHFANKDIVFSFAQEGQSVYGNGYSDNYSLEGNGNLLYTANGAINMNGVNMHANSRVTFTRTGPTTATANLYLNETASMQGITTSGTVSGVLHGTLVNTKDINTTTIDYKNSIFLNKRLKNIGK